VTWAIAALDRLREVELQPGEPPKPNLVPLAFDARDLLEQFAREMQQRQREVGPLFGSAFAKARGQALRLSLVLELLWWCAEEGFSPPPIRISRRAFTAAAVLMQEYFVPMAARVYGEHAVTTRDLNAAVLVRWILRARPREMHVRHLQREVRLLGLRTAGEIEQAAAALVAHGWLLPPVPGVGFGPRPRRAYRVNPLLRLPQCQAWPTRSVTTCPQCHGE
jgi:hypothetical protein